MLAIACSVALTACGNDSESACPTGAQPSVTPSCALGAGRNAGALQSEMLLELSGIAASRTQPGVYYVHNDSDDGPRFFAIDGGGRLLGAFSLPGAAAIDWEDIALGSSGAGSDTLFIGDIGDNGARDGSAAPRAQIQIYRVAEPAVSSGQAPGETSAPWDRLLLRYPDRPHDAETLMFDPLAQELVIVTKESDGRSFIYRVSARAPAESPMTLQRASALPVGGCTPLGVQLFTAGDISRSGNRIALLSYSSLFTWSRARGESVAEALTRPPRSSNAIGTASAEALTFTSDERALLVSGEGAYAPLVEYADDCR